MLTFGETLKNLRLEKELNQVEFAKIFNIAKGTVSNWENNNRFPDKEMLNKIADFFGVSVDYLLGRTEQKPLNKNSKFELTERDKLVIEKEAEKMIKNLEKASVVEFCGTPADEEDKEFLKLAYEKFLSDVRVYNKMKYTPKKYKK